MATFQGVASSVAAGELGAVSGILLGFAGFAVALLAPIGLAVRASRWHVDPNGIGGRNNWLVYHRLDWSEIESIEPGLIPGYLYLQVKGGGKRWAFWLPLFLTDMPRFRSAVARYAPRKTRCGAIWINTRPNRALRVVNTNCPIKDHIYYRRERKGRRGNLHLPHSRCG